MPVLPGKGGPAATKRGPAIARRARFLVGLDRLVAVAGQEGGGEFGRVALVLVAVAVLTAATATRAAIPARAAIAATRSADSRVGQECVSTFSTRWCTHH